MDSIPVKPPTQQEIMKNTRRLWFIVNKTFCYFVSYEYARRHFFANKHSNELLKKRKRLLLLFEVNECEARIFKKHENREVDSSPPDQKVVNRLKPYQQNHGKF